MTAGGTSSGAPSDDHATRSFRWRDLEAPSLAPMVAWPVGAALLLVSMSRSPHLLLRGRFWAEEGTVHFRDAVLEPGVGGLLFVYERAGYLNLHANVATWLGAHGPLEHAPLVSAWLSLAVLAAILWVALFWPSTLLADGLARLLAAVLLTVGTLATPEVWLNSLNAQTYLGILTLLLAFVPVASLSRRRYVAGGILLVVAGLSGLYSVALAPLFLLGLWRDRTRRTLGYAAAISVTGLVQLIVVLSSRSEQSINEGRFSLPTASELVRSVGTQFSDLLLGDQWPTHGLLYIGSVAVVAGGLVLITVAMVARGGRDRSVALRLVLAFVLVQTLIQIGSISRPTGGRYAVVPLAVLLLLLVQGVGLRDREAIRWLSGAACSVVLIAGLAQFWTHDTRLLRCQGCPVWATEVQEYEAGGDRMLEIWPYDVERTWTVELPPRDEPRDD